MTTAPGAARGSDVSRLSDRGGGGRYDQRRAGPDARPLATLSWDLIHRHRRRPSGDPRMSLAHPQLHRLSSDERAGVSRRAAAPPGELP